MKHMFWKMFIFFRKNTSNFFSRPLIIFFIFGNTGFCSWLKKYHLCLWSIVLILHTWRFCFLAWIFCFGGNVGKYVLNIFKAQASRAEKYRSFRTHIDHTRLKSIAFSTCLDNSCDLSVKVFSYVRKSRAWRLSRDIGGWSSNRNSRKLYQFQSYRMIRNS